MLARIRLGVAIVLFLSWLGWLALAVAEKGKTPVVSRAQLAGANLVVLGRVDADPEDPSAPGTTVQVTSVLSGDPTVAGKTLSVMNLRSASPPGASGFPGTGDYVLALVSDGKTFRVAGLPRSPGYGEAMPPRPVIYRWTPAMEAQMKGLGYTVNKP